MSQLEGQAIVLTGASGGIGVQVAQRLRAAGATVVGVGREAMAGVDEAIVADLHTFDGVSALASDLAKRRIDTLINLAGVQYFGPCAEQRPEDLWSGYVVNLIAPAMLAQAVIPGMKARRTGRIVNIGSVFGSIPFAHFVGYSSAKAGLKGLSQALRRELAGTGVEVTHVAPRAVRTPFNSPKVMAFANATKMAMDAPELVADRIVRAMAGGQHDVTIGFPESLFVRLNALAPTLIDRALAANDRKAAALFV